jgi:14-3-3 protein epsilon
MNSRENHVFLAKLCEQTDRYVDMVGHIKEAVYLDGKLSACERNLLATAYKKANGPLRTALKSLGNIISKEAAKASKQLPLVVEYRKK